jgi:hypothetical protein
MVTACPAAPRRLDTLVVDEHAASRCPAWRSCWSVWCVTGRGSRDLPVDGAWNITPTLIRFLTRHLFPPGAMLLTDWGPHHDRWFRSGKDHKLSNLRRVAANSPRSSGC